MSPRLTQVQKTDAPLVVESESIVPEATNAAEKSGTRAQRLGGIVADDGAAKAIGRRKGEAGGAATIAQQAKAELVAVTGLDADHVSAVEQKSDGWHVTVDLVELRRIPAATDVLAAYEAVLGPTGTLLSYRRVRRYFRDQMMEES